MNIEECMSFINSYTKSGGRITDLSRARELMKRVGDPQERLKFVHIAGTTARVLPLNISAEHYSLQAIRRENSPRPLFCAIPTGYE